MKFVLSYLFITSLSYCFSQNNNDSINTILSSATFTLEEEYIGDWGGYTDTFTFITTTNDINVHWESTNSLKKQKNINGLFPISELDNLKKIFTNCSSKIKSSKTNSTENIFYKFKNETHTYIIDDRFTIKCNDAFDAWKKTLLLKAQKNH